MSGGARESRTPSTASGLTKPLLLLLIASLALFGLLEVASPGYFLWDDNASAYLPWYVHNYRSLAEEGELAHLNLHQYLGQIHLGASQPATLYPPVYAAVGLSHLFFGDPRHAVDLLAVAHLVASALGLFLLLRRFGVRTSASLVTALIWISFPFLPLVSRSWIHIAFVAGLLPYNLLLLDRLAATPGAGRVMGLGAVKALLFYQGHVQFAVLTALFDGLFLLARFWLMRETRAGALRLIAHYGLALLATGALAAPLLLPLFEVRLLSAYRADSLSYAEFISNSLPLGHFLLAQAYVMLPRAIHLATGAIFFVGIPALVGLAAVPFTLGGRGADRIFLVALLVAGVALLLATPASGLLYGAPLLSSFRWPFKYFLYFLFFASVALGGLTERLLDRRRSIGILLLAGALLGNLAVLAQPRFGVPFGPNRIDRNLAAIVAELDTAVERDTGRVVSLWLEPAEPRIHRFLVFNYATLFGAYHLGGYDPLIARENLELALGLEYSNIFRHRLDSPMLAYLSTWGVRYLMLPDRPELRQRLERLSGLKRRASLGSIEIYENLQALPVVSFVDRPREPVRFEWKVNGLAIDPEGRSGALRIAVAPLPWYVWSVNGNEQGAPGRSPITRQLEVVVPPGAERVELVYQNVPFRLGVGLSLALLVSASALWAYRRRSRPANISRPSEGKPV